ncbi:hypothetical protein ACSV9I_08015 [Rhizobium sp. G187]|uniref:hypothetical protein n=1 Tax=Rhizobium sp. G187 TaxID=3451352 RepID=UPI003EE6B638
MITLLRNTPILGAILAQVVALPVVAAVTGALSGQVERLALIAIGIVLQGLIAALLSRALGLARWWLLIAFLFPLAMALALSAGQLPAWPFAIVFLVLALVFSNTARGRVPLYLTNGETASVLKRLMVERGATHFTDLGCGLGGVVRALDGEGRRAQGVENAPGLVLLGTLICALTGRGRIRRGDLFRADLSGEDVVYAFLSPHPMAALFAKVETGMKPGSLFVSNSFAVPDRDPDEIWELSDRRGTKLYLYEITGKAATEVKVPASD